MEMKGYIDENLNPKIENVFIIGKEQWIPLETVLDTGFNEPLHFNFNLPKSR